MRRVILKQKFFERPTLAVARGLLGKYLVRRYRGRTVAAMVTEVEAYDGPRDRASHASRGLTPRTRVMFGPAGHWYVYFTYGMHWLANIVTGREGYPAAVLIRGVAADTDERGPKCGSPRMIAGPARVAKYFKIGKPLNGKRVSRASGLWIEDRPACAGRGVRVSPSCIRRTPRIGVDYAGPVWAKKKFRFYLHG